MVIGTQFLLLANLVSGNWCTSASTSRNYWSVGCDYSTGFTVYLFIFFCCDDALECKGELLYLWRLVCVVSVVGL